MNVVRLSKLARVVSLTAAVIVTTLQWTPLLKSSPQGQPGRAAAAPLAGDMSDDATPLFVFTASDAS